MSDLFADLFAACSIFFIRALHRCELSELSGYSIFFLSLFSRRARGGGEAFGCDPVAHLARRGLGVRSYP